MNQAPSGVDEDDVGTGRVTYSIDRRLHKALRKFARRKGIRVTEAVEYAVASILMDAQIRENVDDKTFDRRLLLGPADVPAEAFFGA